MKNEKKLENYFDKINIKILEQFRKIILLLAISLINLARATKERTTHLLNPKKKRSVKTINSDFFGKKIIAGISLIIIASFFISDASATVIRGFDEVRFNGVLLLNATTALDFITNGVTRMYLDSSGNLGIGTTSPSSLLDVRGTGNFSGAIYYDNGTLVGSGSGGSPWQQGADTVYNDSASIKVGIGTNSPQGMLNIENSSAISVPWLNISDNGNEIFIVDNDGQVTKPKQSCFFAYPGTMQSNIAVGTVTTVTFDSERFDLNNDFASNTFTAPVTGLYTFGVNVNLVDLDSASTMYYLTLTTSDNEYIVMIDSDKTLVGDTNSGHSLPLSVIADMDAGDTAYIRIYQGSGTQQTDLNSGDSYTWFSGCLIA